MTDDHQMREVRDDVDRYREEIYPTRTRIARALRPLLGPVYLPLRRAFWAVVRSADGLREGLRRRRVPGSIRWVTERPSTSSSAGELVVCTLVRDGEIYVRELVRHYRALGAKRIVFLDTGSTDRTKELILEASRGGDDVALLETKLPYSHYKDELKNYLAQTFAGDGWALVADIDELFDYPGSADLSLRRFLEYLDDSGFTAVMVHMLDLFSRESPDDDGSGEGFRKNHCWFDPSGYSLVDALRHAGRHARGTTLAGADVRLRFGGVQRRAFGTDLLMSKMALFRPSKGVWMSSDHFVRCATIADVTGVFYHYKFVDDFRGRTTRAVAMGTYYKGSTHYRNIVAALERDPMMRLLSDSSRKLTAGADQLLDLGFLIASDRYRKWLETSAGASRSGP